MRTMSFVLMLLSLFSLTIDAFAQSAWTSYTTADGLPSNDIRSLAIAPDGAVSIMHCNMPEVSTDTTAPLGSAIRRKMAW